MQERLLIIYYGEDRLPYKDENREVHYPIVSSASGGTLITGENNTSKLYFYVGQIGGSGRQWIANIKKPDGTLAYQLCTNGQSVSLGNGYTDYRVELDIADLFADQIGDVKIGLQGYSGNTVIVENDGTYEISGNPVVLATGTILIKVNYAPNVLPKGETLSPTTEQLILASLGTKADITNTIFVASDIEALTIGNFNENQMFFDLATRNFYKLVNNDFQLINLNVADLFDAYTKTETDTLLDKKLYDLGQVDFSTTSVQDIIDEVGLGKAFALQTSETEPLYEGIVLYDENSSLYYVFLKGANGYTLSHTSSTLTYIADLTSDQSFSYASTNYVSNVAVLKTNSTNIVYGNDENGLLTNYNVDSDVSGNIVRRDGSSQIIVPLQQTSNNQATSKKYVDDATQDVREVAEGKCKTFILSYADTVALVKASNKTVIDKNGNDITSQVQNGDYDWYDEGDDGIVANSFFNSQSNSINAQNNYTDGLYILRQNSNYNQTEYGYQFIEIELGDAQDDFNSGDIFLVIETDVPDRWFSSADTFYKLETSKVDLSTYYTKTESDAKYVDLTSAQTITGAKTFDEIKLSKIYTLDGNEPIKFSGTATSAKWFYPYANNVYDLGSSSLAWKDIYLAGNIKSGNAKIELTGGTNITLDAYGSAGTVYSRSKIVPSYDDQRDLGATTIRWKNLYLSGNLSDGTNTVTVSNIAKKENFVKLTQAEYDALGTYDSDTFYFIEEE